AEQVEPRVLGLPLAAEVEPGLEHRFDAHDGGGVAGEDVGGAAGVGLRDWRCSGRGESRRGEGACQRERKHAASHRALKTKRDAQPAPALVSTSRHVGSTITKCVVPPRRTNSRTTDGRSAASFFITRSKSGTVFTGWSLTVSSRSSSRRPAICAQPPRSASATRTPSTLLPQR